MDTFDLLLHYRDWLQRPDPYCQQVNSLLIEMAHGRQPFPDSGVSLHSIRRARAIAPGKVMRLVGLLENHRGTLLVDGGADLSFMDPAFARELRLTPHLYSGTSGASVRLADGRQLPLLQCVDCYVQIGGYHDTLRFLLTPLAGMDAILGADWLAQYQVLADYKARTVSFQGPNGRHHVLEPEVDYNTPACLLSAAEVQASHDAGELDRMFFVLPRELADPATPTLASAVVAGTTPPAAVPTPSPPGSTLPSGIPGVGAQASTLSAQELERVAALSREDLLNLYSDRLVENIPALPPDRGHFNFTIEEGPDATPPRQQAYRLSAAELEELRRQLADLQAKGFIRASSSAYGAPILFVTKKTGEKRLCVDWRRLNSQTIRNAHPLPRIDETLDQLLGAQVMSKLDLANGYYQLLVDPADVHKTAMNCGRYGLWEWLVMGFGLANAPAKFQSLLNHVITPDMAEFCVVYLDDILVFSRSEREHKQHLARVFDRLRQFQLYAKATKCEFFRSELEYLGHIVSADGVRPMHNKVQAVQSMRPPRTPTEIKTFLGMVGYYRRFLPHLAHISKPMRDLEKKDAKFIWTAEHDSAFQQLKDAMTGAPLLKVFDPSRPAVVYCDASEYGGTGACLMQDFGSGLQPIAYESRGYCPAEQNYPVHDKEMLAVIRALKVWRHYLQEAEVTVYTDHHSLQFYNQKNLQFSPRQQRWAFFLQQYPRLRLAYTPGKYNVVADALSRCPTEPLAPAIASLSSLRAKLLPCPAVAATQAVVLGAATRQELHLSALAVSHTPAAVYAEITAGYTLDSAAQAALAAVAADSTEAQPTWELHQELLFYRGGEGQDLRLYVPAPDKLPPSRHSLRQRFISEHHDAPIAGHLGRDKTFEVLSRRFYWPGLGKDVTEYVRSCDTCQRTKTRNQPRLGLAQPLPVPTAPWQVVGMDFITQLPESRHGNTQIVVFTDLLTKMSHFVAAPTPLTADQVAGMYMRHVFRLHGYPTGIVSDRDKRFVSDFWRSLQRQLGSKLHMSTAYHPQTDGQTERMNRTLEEMVRAFVDAEHQAWDELLVAAEFAYNNSLHGSSRFTPFYLNHGRHPHTPAAWLRDAPLPAASQSPDADAFVSTLKQALDSARQHLERAKQVQAAHANKSRKAHTFVVGDKVLLETKFVAASNTGSRTARKFRHLYFGGPLVVTAVISPTAVRLSGFPAQWKGHPVINVSRLRPYVEGAAAFPGRQITDAPPPPELQMDSDESMFDQVLNFVARGRDPDRTRIVLVRWRTDRPDSWHTELELRQWCTEATGDTKRFRELYKIIP